MNNNDLHIIWCINTAAITACVSRQSDSLIRTRLLLYALLEHIPLLFVEGMIALFWDKQSWSVLEINFQRASWWACEVLKVLP